MKLETPGIGVATTCSSPNWFSVIFFAVFLPTISASQDVPQTPPVERNAAEQSVVDQAIAGKVADLTTQFREADRKLSAPFLHDLLTGTLSRVTVHPNGVRIVGAIIDKPIDINNAQIRGDMWLEQCQFVGQVTMHHVSFPWNVSFEGSTFKDYADFENINVGHLAHFNDAVFEKGANFRYANIANNFDALRTVLHGSVFSGMKVGGDALFDNAKFLGPVNFRYANIANNFSANNATFQDAKHGAVFSGMKVGGDATFYAAVFNGPVHFSYADFARLSLSCPFSPEVAAQFHMQGMSYKYIRAVSLPELPLGLEYIPKFPQFEISPVLRKIPLYPLPAYIPKFPRFKFEPMQDPRLMILYPGYRGVPAYLVRPVTFQSPSYVPAILESESESPEELLKLADWSAYSADVYSNLEGFFLRRGDRDDADKAFFAGKHRQREEYFGSGHWFRWLGSWTLDLLVGYGRHPWQAGIPCVVLIALGCVLFSPKKMEPQNPNETPRVYSRFWYSLGLFLPFVDLQVGKVWKPKADETFLRNYMRVHILLGWILIPLVLAAVTGLIK